MENCFKVVKVQKSLVCSVAHVEEQGCAIKNRLISHLKQNIWGLGGIAEIYFEGNLLVFMQEEDTLRGILQPFSAYDFFMAVLQKWDFRSCRTVLRVS